MAIIELENATKTYKLGEVEMHALEKVSLTIEQGEFTALVGPSGSGKTTLLQLIGCLDRPNSAAIAMIYPHPNHLHSAMLQGPWSP